MSNVTVEGIFLGSQIDTKTFDGKETSKVLIDVYQPHSDSANKLVQLRSTDLTLVNNLKDIAGNSPVKIKARVAAYQNNPIFHFISFVK